MTVFDQAFRIVVGEEGAYSCNAQDPGNWTGGACNVGRLLGTKYGIAACSRPSLDISNLTLEEARDIYRTEYWNAVAADGLPPPLALLVFDAAVNNGVSRAVRWLQTAIGAKADGVIGPATLLALAKHAGQGAALCAEFQAQRLAFMASLPGWHVFGLGWARRLCRLPFNAMTMEAK